MTRHAGAPTRILQGGCLLVGALTLGAACASGGVQQSAQYPAGAWTPAGIAQYAAAANNEDVLEAQLAVAKSAEPRVTDFARRMLTDDDAVTRQAAALLGRLGVSGTTVAPSVQSAAPEEEVTGAVLVPPEPNDAGLAALQASTSRSLARLNSLTGGAFDASYIAHQVREHQALLFAIDGTLLPNAHNHDVANFLRSLRLVVQDHLDRARELNKSLGG